MIVNVLSRKALTAPSIENRSPLVSNTTEPPPLVFKTDPIAAGTLEVKFTSGE